MQPDAPARPLSDAPQQPAAPARVHLRGLLLIFAFWCLFFLESIVLLIAGGLAALLYGVLFRRSRPLIALTISSLIALALFEWLGGLVLKQKLAERYAADVDHRMLPHSMPDVNSDGIRSLVEADDFSDETFNIIFLGDSFTYGFLLPDLHDAFPGQIERKLAARSGSPRVRCVNFGWSSSSPLLSYRLLRDIGAKYKPDLVILNLDMTDFHDDVRYARQFRAVRSISPTQFLLYQFGAPNLWRWVRREIRLVDLYDRLFLNDAVVDYYVAHQPLAESRPLLATIEGSIRKAASYAREELNAEFMLVLLPRHFQYSMRECPDDWEKGLYERMGPYCDEPFRWLDDFAESVDFPCHGLLTAFRESDVFPTCFRHDPHWNAAGHQIAADAIIEILEAEGYVPVEAD